MSSPAYVGARDHQEFKVEVAGESDQMTGNGTPTASSPAKKSKRTSFLSSLGFHDYLSPEVWRASVGELLGTGTLVFMIDTIVISTYQMDTQAPNLILATLVALIVAILLIAVGPVSGGHINPIVTFSAALIGLISFSRAFIYIVAQCAGALLGALALRAVVSSAIAETYSLGGCTLTVVTPGPDGPVTTGLETSPALCLEIICSFVFLFASIWMAFDGRQVKQMGRVLVCSIVGLVLGLLVFISTTVTAAKGYAGAGINPARCFGPAVVRGGHLWDGHWIFWVGPALSCVAFYLYTKIIPQEHFAHVELHRGSVLVSQPKLLVP